MMPAYFMCYGVGKASMGLGAPGERLVRGKMTANVFELAILLGFLATTDYYDYFHIYHTKKQKPVAQ